MTRQILQLPPGEWRITEISETRSYAGYQSTRAVTLSIRPTDLVLNIDRGKVSYFGDYLLDFDFDFGSRSAKILKHTYDDAGAAETLASFPGLKGPVQRRSIFTVSATEQRR